MQALKNSARDNDPAKLSLEEGFNKYVRRTHLSDYTEMGIITLKDGVHRNIGFNLIILPKTQAEPGSS